MQSKFEKILRKFGSNNDNLFSFYKMKMYNYGKYVSDLSAFVLQDAFKGVKTVSIVQIWDKVFSNGSSKICGREPLKIF